MTEVKWRLLEYSAPDPKMNLAINEAIFRSRRVGLSPDTLRLWESPNLVIFSGPFEERVIPRVLQKWGAQAVRINSVEDKAIYCDPGSLNFAVTMNTEPLKSLTKDYHPVFSEYQILFEAIAKGLQELGVKAKADPNGAYTKNGRISLALPCWFSDTLLFQGTLLINTNMEAAAEALEEALTSIGRELGRSVPLDDVKKAVVHGFEERLGVRFESQSPLEAEQKLAEKLYRVKYATDKWNIRREEPLLATMGETLVEVYVANPPTSKCRELIGLVNDVAAGLENEVRVVIWMRGLTQQHPDVEPSPGLARLSKASILPAVVVNGGVKFGGGIPHRDELQKAISSPESTPNIF